MRTTAVPADVISNYSEGNWNGRPPLYYDQGFGETALIGGTIRSASPNPNAISQDLVNAAGEALTNQAPVPVDNIDIEGQITAKAGNPHSSEHHQHPQR